MVVVVLLCVFGNLAHFIPKIEEKCEYKIISLQFILSWKNINQEISV